jgi:DNA-binding transcriptional MerR regulator
VKTHFSIKDLENLSGVKAHTIRIWEKRYGLLVPERTETNIRQYNLENLKKLLDVTFIYKIGVKISKIAGFNAHQIKEIILQNAIAYKEHYAINNLKAAMLNFNTDQFIQIYTTLLETKTFEEIFESVFMPFLQEIGMLWHLGTIDVSHERFASELIKRKTIAHIDFYTAKNSKYRTKTKVCLFLPYEEIHDIGLLYANFQLEKFGINTVYLGPNIPLESLSKLFNKDEKIIFLTYFTIKPDTDKIKEYLDSYQKIVCQERKVPLWVLGQKFNEVQKEKKHANIEGFNSIKSFQEKVKTLIE